MDWYLAIFELIDMRSFSNLWYWIILAVIWSSASHWVLGVPWDMAGRARRHGGEADQDFHDMVRINTNRILYVAGEMHLLMTGFLAFALTSLALLGFVWKVEFAQSLFFLGLPMTLVWILSVSTARRIRSLGLAGPDLYHEMGRHRFYVQIIGMIAIVVTAVWGMIHNLLTGPLGG